MRSILIPDGRLHEMPEISKPATPSVPPLGCYTWQDYQKALEAYNAALSKCRQLQVVGTHGWKVGDVLECGKDYKLEIQCSLKSRCECSQGLKVLEGINEDCLYSSYVAVPIADSQEELWREVMNEANGGAGVTTVVKFVLKMKKQFTITRKQ